MRFSSDNHILLGEQAVEPNANILKRSGRSPELSDSPKRKKILINSAKRTDPYSDSNNTGDDDDYEVKFGLIEKSSRITKPPKVCVFVCLFFDLDAVASDIEYSYYRLCQLDLELSRLL